MPDINDIYSGGGAYLKGDDLADCDDLTVTISGVEIKDFDDGRKAVLSFEETDKRLTLNKGNAAMVKEVCGSPNTDSWIGNTITIYGTLVEYQGKQVNGIRIRPPARKATGKKPAFLKKAFDERNPPPHPGSHAELDDEVPFAPEWRG